MKVDFEYCKLGDFTYHVLHDPKVIKEFLLQWIMREWEIDHNEEPHEHWTVAWINSLPKMVFSLKIVELKNIHPNPDLMSVADFISDLEERADEREESMLRGVSIEPLLVNREGFALMDGYTRYTVLKRHDQKEVYVYLGTA